MTLGIVATVRTYDMTPIRSWVRYHRALGFERLYLFMDPDDQGLEETRRLPGVAVIVIDDAYRESLRHHSYAQQFAAHIFATGAAKTSPNALTALQLANMAVGLDLARRDGIRWLLHIDSDELFYPGKGDAREHFQLLDDLSIGQARYINHEAVPVRDEHEDFFAEITLFKRNGAEVAPEVFESLRPYFQQRGHYFLAYDNGKCAVRTLPGVTPATAHGFRLPVVALGRASLSSPSILHYPFTSFERYWAKFQRLGEFPSEELLGQSWNPPQFLGQSRDLVNSGDREKVRKAYRRAVVISDKKRVAELLERQVLMRISGPATILREKE
jgi:hypothetical protein